MELSHIGADGLPKMVDVGDKHVTRRVAVVRGRVFASPATLDRIVTGELPKGEVLATAKIAGISAAKETSRLIPMCHNIFLNSVELSFAREENSLFITASVAADAVTGVEMEALTAVTIAALTVYDMAKAVDKNMVIGDICLLEKTGGKSGAYKREE